MKKLVMAGAILATSMGAMADNTTHDGIITNLTNVYGGLGGVWGTAHSDGATAALGSLFAYADSIGGGYEAPSVSWDPATGLEAAGGSIGTAFVEADFEAEIDGVVEGVSNDLFGTADLGNLEVATATNGHLSLVIGNDDDDTTIAVSGIASDEAALGFTFINSLVDDIETDPLSVTQADLDTAITGANAAFGFINTAVVALDGIGSLNDATQTSSEVDAYKVNAVNGVVTFNSLTYCSYEDYAKGTSSDPADC